jgi:hypothetical protein
MPSAAEQRVVEDLAQPVQRRADRRLAEEQPRRRPRHAALAHQRIEGAQHGHVEAADIT